MSTIAKHLLTTLLVGGTVVILSGCSKESPRVQEAQKRVDQLVTALEQGDVTTTRSLLIENGSEIWTLLPLEPEQRDYIVAGLRSRQLIKESNNTVYFKLLYQINGEVLPYGLYVRFEPGRTGIVF